jgi:RimJ/RimL family protein N-acetyltransferase
MSSRSGPAVKRAHRSAGGALACAPDRIGSGSLETPRLRLDPWTEAHTELLVRLSSIPEVMRFIGPGVPWSPTHAQEAAAAKRQHWIEHGFGWRPATEKGTAELVGLMALNFVGTGTTGLDATEYEIGWWLAPQAWGRGLAREGALAMRDEAFDALSATSVVARIQPANGPSIAVAQAAGLRHVFNTVGEAGEPVVIYRLAAVDRPPRASEACARHHHPTRTVYKRSRLSDNRFLGSWAPPT